MKTKTLRYVARKTTCATVETGGLAGSPRAAAAEADALSPGPEWNLISERFVGTEMGWKCIRSLEYWEDVEVESESTMEGTGW